MEPILGTLLGLHSLVAPRQRPSDTPIVPAPNLIGIFARMFPDVELARAIEALASPREDGERLTGLANLTRLAQAIDLHLRGNPQLAPRLHTFHDIIATMCAIDSFSHAEPPRALDLHLQSADILRYTRELYIKTGAAQPDVIVVGLQATEPIKIEFKGDSYAERRLQIGYGVDQVYPRLYPRTPTKSAIDARPRERAYWIQKDVAAYNLEIYTYGRRLKGTVRTMPIEWPLVIEGISLKLHIPALAGTRLLATDVADERERVVARCVRVAPQPNLAA